MLSLFLFVQFWMQRVAYSTHCDDLDGDGISACDGDCNDINAYIYPKAPEYVGDGIDQDCDGKDLERKVSVGTELTEGDIIISEIMHTPQAVADNLGEWFEIHNTLNIPVHVDGISVTGVNGTGFTIESTNLMPAGGYAVFATRLSSTINGGIDNVFEQYFISELCLYIWGSITLSSPNGYVIDEVVYDT